MLRILTCVCLCAVSANAQDAMSVTDRSHGVSRAADGSLRADGPRYKMRFERDSIAYVPALGMRAPHNFPVGFRPVRMTRGQVSNALAEVSPEAHGGTVEYVRGEGVREAWRVGAAGIEWSYTFAHRPTGKGDLLIECLIDTELVAHFDDGGRGGIWRLYDLGGVTMGGVTGIDARGKRVAGRVSVEGNELTLALPDEFVETAAYPIVLDPLIGTEFSFSGGSGPESERNPDIAYNGAHLVYHVVWSEAFSALDVDVRAQSIDESGSLVGAIVPVAVAPQTIEQKPTTACFDSATGPTMFVAWEQGGSPFGPWEIWGRRTDAAQGGSPSDPPRRLSFCCSSTDPDLGGGERDVGGDGRALLVYDESGTGIVAVALRNNAVGLSVVSRWTLAADQPGVPVESPSVAKADGGRATWLVTWVHRPDQGVSPVFPWVAATSAAAAGGSFSPVMVTQPTGGIETPAVDGDGSSWVVAWEELGDIYCRRVDQGLGSLSLPAPAVVVQADPMDDEIQPDVTRCGPKMIVTWADELALPNSFPGYSINGIALDPQLCTPCGRLFRVINSQRLILQHPGMASSSHAGFGDRGLLVFQANSLATLESDVNAHFFSAFAGVGGTVDLGGGCAGGGSFVVTGAPAIGNPDFAMGLTGADPTTLAALFVIGVGTNTFAPLCAACDYVRPDFSFPVPLAAGAVTIPTPLPCVPAFAGFVAEHQFWLIGTQGTGCNVLPNVSLSPIVRVTLGL
ncbi:MAG: hypothetical protein H6834_18200 [Planctomycetes bacterium]|nr:hypothetical protein [Planctomycetota bacterium]MCB9891520.1 hypothetical protein [Planctomycetota bacterium]